MHKSLLLLALVTLCACVHSAPQPVPTPTPTPIPTPTPTPEPPKCNLEPPTLNRLNLKIHTVGPNWVTLDVTPQVRDLDFCAQVGFPGNLYCPLGQEGDECRPTYEREVMGGIPSWRGVGEPSPQGDYLWRVRKGTAGDVTVCNSAGNVCSTLRLTGNE